LEEEGLNNFGNPYPSDFEIADDSQPSSPPANDFLFFSWQEEYRLNGEDLLYTLSLIV